MLPRLERSEVLQLCNGGNAQWRCYEKIFFFAEPSVLIACMASGCSWDSCQAAICHSKKEVLRERVTHRASWEMRFSPYSPSSGLGKCSGPLQAELQLFFYFILLTFNCLSLTLIHTVVGRVWGKEIRGNASQLCPLPPNATWGTLGLLGVISLGLNGRAMKKILLLLFYEEYGSILRRKLPVR